MQQSIFKFFDNTLALDAAERFCILQNSIKESRTTVGKKGDFLTMEQTKSKTFSNDQSRKHYGTWSKKQPLSTLNHVGKNYREIKMNTTMTT